MNEFELQPELLSGDLLELIPLKESDFESLYTAASDPLIWELHPEPTRYQKDVFERFFRGAIESHGAFLIRDRKTNATLGSSRYYDLSPGRIVIGYTFLSRSTWGGNYNRELKQLMLDHAFHFVDTVEFEVGVRNFRSRRALEKIGAKYEREKNPENVVYSISKGHWPTRSFK